MIDNNQPSFPMLGVADFFMDSTVTMVPLSWVPISTNLEKVVLKGLPLPPSASIYEIAN